MVREVNIEELMDFKVAPTIIDVRSPGEFEKGHIPEAVNIPLFTNKERAEVGTRYVRTSREEAVSLGYKYVTPKLDWFIEESKRVAGKTAIAVHCWRGGMRSKAFAEHLQKNGLEEIYVIIGGYKAFRRLVLNYFEQDLFLRVIGGYTGSGKTCILGIMQELGEQVIDLEALAHHKGSVFGGLGEEAQPSAQQFENNLFANLKKLDLKRPIWVEDESRMIGHLSIPGALFRQMREQALYFIDIPREKRAQHLVKEYAVYGDESLRQAINSISKRLGGQNVKRAYDFLAENNYLGLALLVLQYYDKAYRKGLLTRDQQKVITISLQDPDHTKNAKEVLKSVRNL